MKMPAVILAMLTGACTPIESYRLDDDGTIDMAGCDVTKLRMVPQKW